MYMKRMKRQIGEEENPNYYRYFECKYYIDCLDLAAGRGWASFSCRECRYYPEEYRVKFKEPSNKVANKKDRELKRAVMTVFSEKVAQVLREQIQIRVNENRTPDTTDLNSVEEELISKEIK